ncbi:hypothetical protein [Flavobacterium soli]|uniref:hypothetical protein n=1 Tax=Flavobacterium soli TaxID=344881 RepID=UPI000479A0AB|nr:hypothetical protein [Flavobacterium soli]
MNIDTKEISESEYNYLQLPVLFEDKLTDRVFGLFSNGINEYKFGWQSTIIKPHIDFIDSSRCLIGIDLNFIIFEITTGEIFLKLSLDYFYYDTKINKDLLYVITELEIIKLSIIDFRIIQIYSLPDFFESIEFYDERIVIKCVNDEIINI